MDNQIFLNPAIFPPLELENTWNSLPSPMQTQSSLSHDCFQSSTTSSDQFDSTLTSMDSDNNTLIKELTGKLSNICNTPLNPPPKMVQENFPYVVNSTAMPSSLPTMYGDPGFPERAARLSCLGSKSFNGRIAQVGYSRNNLGDHSQTQRVSTSPLANLANTQGENTTINGDSGGNTRNPSDVIGEYRKRKGISKAKVKENDVPLHTICNKEGNEEEKNAKRSKTDENGGRKEMKREENRGDEGMKQRQKGVEPPQDYIHVRARRGQATDSHSLAERVRREKISQRMKLLQDLVPGCNKVTGKALMLDEIINYVQSLQRQVEFLSMKLASLNPSLQSNMNSDGVLNDAMEPNNMRMGHVMCPIDSLASSQYGQPNNEKSSKTSEKARMAPCLNSNPINQNSNASQTQSPLLRGFPNVVPQLPSLYEGDLQSIVQMGYGRKE